MNGVTTLSLDGSGLSNSQAVGVLVETGGVNAQFATVLSFTITIIQTEKSIPFVCYSAYFVMSSSG